MKIPEGISREGISSPRVQILTEGLVNRIAAGEVVERPASVVKELVENSLDAGASFIEVEVRGGGREYIGVLDDGCGMSREDAELALQRHATSKLRSEDDLTRIASLGFRGEALPSVAAVSKLRLTTCSEDSSIGTQVAVEGGVIKGVLEAGCPRGTFLQVEELFFNTPARLKFLKKPSTELARIGEALTLLALSHPGVGFTLKHEGRFLLEVSHSELPSRASALLGRELFSLLLPLEEASGELSLKGFIAPPSFHRPRRSQQYLFVNRRPVRDSTAGQALYEGYRGQLPQGRHPVYLIFLDLPPEGVDVNVHPAKREVRFREPDLIFRFLRGAVRRALEVPVSCFKGKPYALRADSGAKGGVLEAAPPYGRRPLAFDEGEPRQGPSKPRAFSPSLPLRVPLEGLSLGGARYLGQLWGSFLLFEGEEGLLVLDQHAAHERILYEKLEASLRKGELKRQGLLLSLTLDLTPGDALILEEHLGTLTRLGFEVEPFGGRSFLLRAVPALLSGEDPGELISWALEEIRATEEKPSLGEMAERLLRALACRAAVKADRALKEEEVRALGEALESTPFRWCCPHGRPLALLVEREEFLRKFHRS